VFVEELTAPGDLGPWAYLRSLNEPRVLVANTHGEMRAAMAEFDLVINHAVALDGGVEAAAQTIIALAH